MKLRGGRDCAVEEKGYSFPYGGQADHGKAVDGQCFGFIFLRYGQQAHTVFLGLHRDRKDPAYRDEFSGEAQFPGGHDIFQTFRRDFSGGSEKGEGNGEIEAGAALGNVGRRKIDRDPLRGKRQPCIVKSGTDPVLGFPYLRGQISDHRKDRQSVPCVCLHAHGRDVESIQCRGHDTAVHKSLLFRLIPGIPEFGDT